MIQYSDTAKHQRNAELDEMVQAWVQAGGQIKSAPEPKLCKSDDELFALLAEHMDTTGVITLDQFAQYAGAGRDIHDTMRKLSTITGERYKRDFAKYRLLGRKPKGVKK